MNPVGQRKIEPMDSGGSEENNRPTRTKPTQQQKFSEQADLRASLATTSEEETGPESVKEINDFLSRPDEAEGIGGSSVTEIITHNWKFGGLHFKVRWSSGETTWHHLNIMRQDYPKITARYIVENKVSRSTRSGDRVLLWAKKVLRDIDRAVRRIIRLYDLYLDDHDEVRMTRRVQKGSRKRKKLSLAPLYKYGIQVPRNAKQAQQLDEANGNTLWQDAMDKELNALLDMDCFEFHPAGHHKTLGSEWQRTTLHMVFDVKQSLQRKARLVASGHLVEMMDVQVYSSTAKSISMQLLHVISHNAGLKQLCGDIGVFGEDHKGLRCPGNRR